MLLGPTQAVYGRSANFDFPLSLQKFNYFYRDLLESNSLAPSDDEYGLNSVPMTHDIIGVQDAWFDPAAAGTAGPGAAYGTQAAPTVHSLWVYLYPNAGCPHGSWPHATPAFEFSAGFASNTKIEIMHTCCDDPRNGFWTYLAIGSGVAMTLGTTVVYPDHQAAFAALGLPAWNNPDFSQMVVQARARGWDTIQFTHRCEGRACSVFTLFLLCFYSVFTLFLLCFFYFFLVRHIQVRDSRRENAFSSPATRSLPNRWSGIPFWMEGSACFFPD